MCNKVNPIINATICLARLLHGFNCRSDQPLTKIGLFSNRASIGAFIIGFINNGLNMLKMDSFYQYICKGIVILIAVYMDDYKNTKMLKGSKK